MGSVATGYKPGKLDGRQVMTWRKGANNRRRRFRLPALEIGRPRSLIMLLYYAVRKRAVWCAVAYAMAATTSGEASFAESSGHRSRRLASAAFIAAWWLAPSRRACRYASAAARQAGRRSAVGGGGNSGIAQRPSFGLEVTPRTLPWTGVRIDRCRLQIGMAEGGRHKRDRRPVVDRVAGMSVPQPMDRDGRVDPGALGGRLDHVIHGALGKGLAGRRTEPNTGADAGASPQLASSRAAISAGISTCRTLSPSPTISSCASRCRDG